MEDITGKEKIKICPYLETPCQPICPAWIDTVGDCLFHVCLTGVKETFQAAAVYLDTALNLAEGEGLKMLQGLRGRISGKSSEVLQDTGIVLSSLMVLISQKIEAMPVEDIAEKVTKIIDSASSFVDDIFEDE